MRDNSRVRLPALVIDSEIASAANGFCTSRLLSAMVSHKTIAIGRSLLQTSPSPLTPLPEAERGEMNIEFIAYRIAISATFSLWYCA